MSPSLSVFFEEMEGFLLGERSAAAVLERLGPSSSGRERFAHYAELVARQRRAVLDHFYRAARAASDATQFDAWRDAHLRRRPPKHWVPSEAARSFTEQLVEVGAPTHVVELADFAFVRWSVLREPLGGAVTVDRTHFVRHYDYDVVSFTRDIEGSVTAMESASAPEARPTLAVVMRHQQRGELLVGTPSLAALFVLEIASSGRWPALTTELTVADVLSEARRIEGLGWLPPGTSKRLVAADGRAS